MNLRLSLPAGRVLRLMPAVGLLWLTGCDHMPAAALAGDTAIASELHIVSHGWHAGIVIRRADIPVGVWPETADFPDAEFLEVGWGDRVYYQARNPGLGAMLKAAFWPTPSVLHVAGFRGPVSGYFPHSRVIVLPVTRAGLARLTVFIDAAHDRPAPAATPRLGRGLYGDSYYYAARESFHLFNNCNRWIARALRAAGHDVRDSITVGGLLDQLEPDSAAAGSTPEP